MKKGIILMEKTSNWEKNGSGYPDPTATDTIKNVDILYKEKQKFNRFIRMIFAVCKLYGYHLEERIVVKDVSNGRIWK